MHNSQIEKFEPPPAQQPVYQNELERKANELKLSSYNMYKRNMVEFYKIYDSDEDYKRFINAMEKTLKAKAQNSTKTNFRFSQENTRTKNSEYDFNSFFNEQSRNAMTTNLEKTLSSDSLQNGLKSQIKIFQDPDFKGIYKKETDFFTNEDNYAKNDKRAVDLATQLYGSLTSMGEKYKDQVSNGILTVDGQITNEPAKYIKEEEEKFKENFKNARSYNYDDIKNIMHLQDYKSPDSKMVAK